MDFEVSAFGTSKWITKIISGLVQKRWLSFLDCFIVRVRCQLSESFSGMYQYVQRRGRIQF